MDRGKFLDLSSPASPNDDGRSPSEDGAASYLGVHFVCCDVYARVYPNRERTAYLGHCPRCAKRVKFLIGPGGSDSRFFVAQ